MPGTTEPPNAFQILVARAALYKALSVALAYPRPAVRDFLAGGLLAKVEAAVAAMPAPGDLGEAVAALRAVSGAEDDLEGEYNRLFRTVLACSPYETAYDPLRETRTGTVLADVAGFYEAFGLRPSATIGDLPDHIAAELEFMNLALARDAEARAEGLDEEAGRCADAARKFLADHLGGWGQAFAARLVRDARAPIYAAVGGLLGRFLAAECRRAGLPVAPPEAGAPAGSGEVCPLECPETFAKPGGGPIVLEAPSTRARLGKNHATA